MEQEPGASDASDLSNKFGLSRCDGRWVQSLTDAMQNDENDGHVLACAVVAGASVIVTSNLKHFKQEALDPFRIEPQSPSQFLINTYDLNPAQAMTKLSRQAEEFS